MPTQISTSHGIAQKIYRPGLIHQAEVQSIAMNFVGTEEDAAVHLQDEPSRLRGDTVQIRFSPTRDVAGFGQNDTIEGNEASLDFDFQELKINYWAFAFSQRNQMSQQRVNINLKKAALQKLPLLWRRNWDRSFWHQLAGFTPVNTTAGVQTYYGATTALNANDYSLSGMNVITAVDADHIYRAGGLATDDLVGADTTKTLTLDYIDELVTRAMSTSYLDYPIPPTSSGYYYLVIHPEQLKQLRQNTTAGDWQDIQRALLEGGMDYKKNAIYRGHAGVYNQTIILVSDYIPKGVQNADSAAPQNNTRRAVFLGAKAGVIAFGEGYTDGQHLDWTEQVRDYKVWGVSADTVWGMLRTQFDDLSGASQTFGNLVLTTYSAV